MTSSKFELPALLGGKKTIKNFTPYNSIKKRNFRLHQRFKIRKIIKFHCRKNKNFYGGVYVNKFENYLKIFMALNLR